MSGSQDSSSEPGSQNKTPKSTRRDRVPSGGGFWYLLVAGILAAVLFSVMTRGYKGEKFEYSDFIAKVRSGDLPKERIWQLEITQAYITWQDYSKKDILANPALPWKRYYTPLLSASEQTRNELCRELDQKGVTYGFSEPSPEWQALLPLLLTTVLLVGGFVFIMRRLGGAGSAMSFGRSRKERPANEMPTKK
ncbi:MAG: hypothetical protein WCK86_21145 [Planctomycetia bacterium]